LAGETAERQITPLRLERATFTRTTVAPWSWELNTQVVLLEVAPDRGPIDFADNRTNGPDRRA
jgi:hypothetical protein